MINELLIGAAEHSSSSRRKGGEKSKEWREDGGKGEGRDHVEQSEVEGSEVWASDLGRSKVEGSEVEVVEAWGSEVERGKVVGSEVLMMEEDCDPCAHDVDVPCVPGTGGREGGWLWGGEEGVEGAGRVECSFMLLEELLSPAVWNASRGGEKVGSMKRHSSHKCVTQERASSLRTLPSSPRCPPSLLPFL